MVAAGRILGRLALATATVLAVPAFATAAPAVSILDVSDPLLSAAETTTAVTWTAGEPGVYSVRRDGATCADGTQLASGTFIAGELTTALAAAALAEGPNTIRVCLSGVGADPGPGTATTTITRDTHLPETTIAAALLTGASARFTLASDEPAVSFECSLDAGGFAACPGDPAGYDGLVDGPHTFRARAVDAAGNVDPQPAERTWTVDTTRVDTAIGEAPAPFTAQRDATFAFSSSTSGAAFECSLDGAAWEACSSPRTYRDLVDETHVFLVRARGPGGAVDQYPASRIWTVDTVSPETVLERVPPALAPSAAATLAFSSDEVGAAFGCSLDGAPWSSCASPLDLAGLANGAHSLAVRAVDRAGNNDQTPAVAAWTVAVPAELVDMRAPRPVRRLVAEALDHGALLSWTLPGDVDLDHVVVERRPLVPGAGAPVSFELGLASAFRDRGLRNGTRYRYLVAAVDEAGNRSRAVDVEVRPAARLLLGPAGPVAAGGTARLAWAPVRGATYYNLQLYRGSTKVLSSWPRRSSLRVAGSWSWEGRGYRLEPGRYTWYVWPGFGARAETRFGDLLGTSTFRVRRR